MVREDSEQTRTVDTPQGPLTYVLVRKPVKNLNLRVCFGEKIMVSIPRRYSVERADDFVREKSGWVWDILHRQESRREISLPSVSPEECGRLLREALLRVREQCKSGGCKLGGYPLFLMRDPREKSPELAAWNTLLFQLDDDAYYYPTGDVGEQDLNLNTGTLNFLIRSEDLKNGDFSRIVGQFAYL